MLLLLALLVPLDALVSGAISEAVETCWPVKVTRAADNDLQVCRRECQLMPMKYHLKATIEDQLAQDGRGSVSSESVSRMTAAFWLVLTAPRPPTASIKSRRSELQNQCLGNTILGLVVNC